MPVTEFATFKFKQPYHLYDEQVQQNLRLLSSWQCEWSGCPLTFYQNSLDPSIIYLLSGWQNVAAHMKWIECDRNQHLLKVFEPILSITGFTHIEMDFGEIQENQEVLRVVKTTVGNQSVQSDLEDGARFLWKRQGQSVEEEGDLYIFCAYLDREVDLDSPLASAYIHRIILA